MFERLIRCANSGFQRVSVAQIIFLHQFVVQRMQGLFKVFDMRLDCTLHRCLGGISKFGVPKIYECRISIGSPCR
jgi:hypothetical protein